MACTHHTPSTPVPGVETSFIITTSSEPHPSFMPKTYTQYHQGLSPNNTHSRQRSWGNPLPQQPATKRVWVKKDDGPPTTLMMGPQDLVDDLKLAITYKYPTTLARQFDPADIQIHLRVPDEPVKKHKPKQSSLNRIVLELDDNSISSGSTITGSRSPSLPATSTFGGSIVMLEPDQNIWDLLDEYFGGAMGMNDALTIVAAQRQPSMPYGFVDIPDRINLRPLEYNPQHNPSIDMSGQGPIPPARGASPTNVLADNYHHPRPQHAFPVNTNALGKNPSVLPSLTHRLSPVNGAISVHKRSHSNPPQLPSMSSVNQMTTKSNGQAVLLLPKNFTLGEQSHLKRYSLDESMVNKNFSNHGKSLLDSTNVTSIGTNPESEEEKPAPRKTSQELSRSSSGSHTLEKPQKRTEEKPPATSRKTSLEGLTPADVRDAKPISTFERVLPSLLVLVVEDNAINQAILGAFLRKHKIRYQIAKNGQEAIDKWRQGGFHLVLMDIQLPVKSGIEATKEIRYLEKVNRIGVFAQHELSKLNGLTSIKEDEKLDLKIFRSPVIIVALTASSNSSVDRKNALTAGCNDFLTKPVNLVWLQNKITEWGCMQALIDYDGWKVKRSGKGDVPKVAMPKTSEKAGAEKPVAAT